MWQARQPVWWVVLGAQAVHAGLRRPAGWDAGSFAVAAVDGPDLASLVRALESLALQAGAAAQAQVLVSDHWLGSASVPWSHALVRPAHASREAAEHLQAAGHEVEAGDSICLDDAPRGQPRLALAFPAVLTQALGHWVAGLGCSRLRIGSLGVHVASRVMRGGALPIPGTLVVTEPSHQRPEPVSLVQINAALRRVEQIVARRLASRDALAPTFVRLGWAVDTAACTVLEAAQPPVAGAALHEHEPSAWLRWLSDSRPVRAQALDLALVRQSPTSPIYRAASAGAPVPALQALVLALLVCGIGWLAGQAHAHWRQVQSGRSALQASDAASRQVAAPLTKEKSERLAAVNQAVAHLNIPLDGVFLAVQPPRDIRVSLLGLEASAPAAGPGPTQAVAAPIVKVLAEAPTAADMTRYVTYLSGRAPLTRAQLARHEVITDGKAGTAYRFAVDVEWQQ